ncbi:MAG: hypothetical protein MJ240_07890 [Kiritimatiellae bacterium]|nr:hypothetical protein [Kiritimatiellia bacterium]
MIISRRLVCVAVGACAGVLLGGTCTWNPAGNGGWADAGRWIENQAPGAGDVVVFNACTGLVTSADAATLAKVAEVTLTGNASGLIISNAAADGVFEFGKKVSGDGVLIKTGDGVTKMTYAESAEKTGYWMSGGLEVLDGTLVLPRSPAKDLWLTKLTVMSPGVFVHTGTSYTRVLGGVWGTGTISNDVSKPLYIGGGSAANPAVFAGRFTSQAYPCSYNFSDPNNKVQHYIGAQSDNAKGFLHYCDDGTVGLVRFGNSAEGNLTSVGAVNQMLAYRGLRPRLLYLGSGEVSTREIHFGTGGRDAVLDAGEQGGLQLNGRLSTHATECNHMNAFTLTGNGENVFNMAYATVTNPAGRNVSHYVTKDGDGSWRFTAGKVRTMIGTLEVKKGTLKFDSIAERGTDCAVGPANLTHSKYYGNYNATKPETRAIDDSKAVPYAFLLGNGVDATTDPHLATLDYTGTTDAEVHTRVIAVKGTGRLKTTSAALVWDGVTAAEAGNQTLVLANADYPLMAVVTNGPGTMSVVKEGGGLGYLGRGSAFSGDLAVKGGTLRITGGQYGWYRLTITETWQNATNAAGEVLNTGGGSLVIRQFALLDDQGENQILNLPHNKSADGSPWLLKPGEAAIGCTNYRILGTDDRGREVTWALSNMFTTAGTSTGMVRRNLDNTSNITYRGFNTESNRMMSVVVRLPQAAKAVTHYDIRCSGYWPYADSSTVRMPRAWTLEGSCDGMTWDMLSTITTNDNTYANIPTGATGHWYSNNSSTPGMGYGPMAAEAAGETPLQVASVAAAAGAKVEVLGGRVVTANGLSLDCAAGEGGVLSGIAFAADSTVRLTGFDERLVGTALPISLPNCTGLNGSKWKVMIDGVSRPSYFAFVSESGVRVFRHGLIIGIR